MRLVGGKRISGTYQGLKTKAESGDTGKQWIIRNNSNLNTQGSWQEDTAPATSRDSDEIPSKVSEHVHHQGHTSVCEPMHTNTWTSMGATGHMAIAKK